MPIMRPVRSLTLNAFDYDYWALGHVHGQQVIQETPRIVYPGVLLGRHIRETGEKGCMLITVEDMQITGCEHHRMGVVQRLRHVIDTSDLESMAELEIAVKQSLDALLATVDRDLIASALSLPV